jgi:hypothetical protein
MLTAKCGFSEETDAFAAGKQALEDAVNQLQATPDIIWLFPAIGYNPSDLLRGIRTAVPGVPLIGCTTDGEISSKGLSTNSVVVLAIKSAQIKFRTAFVPNAGSDSFNAGVKLAEQLPRAYLQIFSDGLTVNGSELLRGIQSVLGENIPVVGGSAGDGSLFRQTFQFHHDDVLTDSVVAVSFEGGFDFGIGVRSGWRPIGVLKKVTKSIKNVVYEIDHDPALNVYEKFLGKHAALLPAVGVEYPLSLFKNKKNISETDSFICRATMSVNRAEKSITFAGDVPQDSYVKMTMGNEADIIDATRIAARQALDQLSLAGKKIKPAAIFFYSCMARKIVLGTRTGEEIEVLQEVVGKDVPIIGFYSYGEFAPLEKEGRAYLHNETATLTIISEKVK